MANFEITCPCCKTMLVVDRISGEVLLEKAVSAPVKSLESMVSQLAAEKSEASKRFDKGIESQKDRGRILEERFKEALERADKDTAPFRNPMDMD